MKHNEQNIWAAAIVALISGIGIGFLLDQDNDEALNAKNNELLAANAANAKMRRAIRDKEQMLAALNTTIMESRRSSGLLSVNAHAVGRLHAQSQEMLKHKNEMITKQVEEYKELSKKYAKAMTELYILHQRKNKIDKGKK